MQISILEYLDKTISSYPEKTAIVEDHRTISFYDLDQFARKIATRLITIGVENIPVAVFMPKGINAIVSFLGINLSGNFYVPLDIKSPISRVNNILDVLKSDYILTDKKHIDLLAGIKNKKVFVIDDIIDEIVADNELIKKVLDEKIDTDPVYSIFTSGSTGTPKGVVISHRSVIDYIDWAIETYDVTSNEIIGNQAPFYFDNSVLDIYLMYATGATLVIVPESYYIFPAKLVDYLNEQKVNFVFWVPFALMNIANFNIFEKKNLKFMKKVLFAGEVMPNKHLNYWRKYLPDCLYSNLYGPTEITVDCTYYNVDREFDDNEPLPIGIPCRNSDVIILNSENKRAKEGEQGELCVRGSSLALGYYGDWEKTQKVFVQNPLNPHYPEMIYRTGDLVYLNERKEIIFVGRKDFQIKHNGYRIELGEIENAALATKAFKNVCCVYDNIKKRIILFYESSVDPEIKDIRISMLDFIPKYMIPSNFIKLDKMPINSNGKIDRLKLNNEVLTK